LNARPLSLQVHEESWPEEERYFWVIATRRSETLISSCRNKLVKMIFWIIFHCTYTIIYFAICFKILF
jgi:hypothetical protein